MWIARNSFFWPLGGTARNYRRADVAGTVNREPFSV
jgi:hypothetical protein